MSSMLIATVIALPSSTNLGLLRVRCAIRSGQLPNTRGVLIPALAAIGLSNAEVMQVWRAFAGNQFLGFFVVDYVIGKHLVIDYAISLDPGGSVRRVDIMEYREAYGGEIRGGSWLAQFVGKTAGSALQLNQDVRNIAGATLSSRHVTEGVKKVLALHAIRLK